MQVLKFGGTSVADATAISTVIDIVSAALRRDRTILVASAVSGSTSYLINNDVTSTSGKNKKARELNIPILSEDEFVDRYTIH